jgi:PilZ domain
MQMSERRGQQRHRTFFGARLDLNHGLSSLDCLVRNIGGRGAKLAVSQPALVPSEFVLHLPKTRQTLRGRVKWRDAEGCGVELCAAIR